MSAYAQNPPPFSAEQWWNPPPTLMAHPRSIASLAAKIEPPTCKLYNLVPHKFQIIQISTYKHKKTLTCLRNG